MKNCKNIICAIIRALAYILLGFGSNQALNHDGCPLCEEKEVTHGETVEIVAENK